MATNVDTYQPITLPLDAVKPTTQASPPPPTTSPLSSNSTTVTINPSIKAPFNAIRSLFDHLYTNPDTAKELNATYPRRGILKTAATHNTTSDQKFTIDISGPRCALMPEAIRIALAPHGLPEVLEFFNTVSTTYIPPVLSHLNSLSGLDLHSVHRDYNVNLRLADYNPLTASPDSLNGCGAHTDYGTFTIIFQDGTPGLELEEISPCGKKTWAPVPGDATVILTGWCAVILSGGRIKAARHRVRRMPGVRRLSAILFLAPDLDVPLAPLEGVEPVRAFSELVMEGEMKVGEFKEVMGKRWRYREGNEEMEGGRGQFDQDAEIERLIYA
ncbi:2OG-FeII oxygenase superfamily protein [Aspergillus mulundensis]|uniref:2OG-FeII oxygenase superfamily protein n=1 Tax=Aspergillus mulundensis TaxID=1810919 RepID=A0A3D8SBV0_9EURO|nr:2OG-FeII oxygenase superfamily protein [Aspergillus mulundensis]RDW83661.1 2OG-FeII oxygenase superfamily protein [Aspergillus mulundensis]